MTTAWLAVAASRRRMSARVNLMGRVGFIGVAPRSSCGPEWPLEIDSVVSALPRPTGDRARIADRSPEHEKTAVSITAVLSSNEIREGLLVLEDGSVYEGSIVSPGTRF